MVTVIVLLMRVELTLINILNGLYQQHTFGLDFVQRQRLWSWIVNFLDPLFKCNFPELFCLQLYIVRKTVTNKKRISVTYDEVRLVAVIRVASFRFRLRFWSCQNYSGRRSIYICLDNACILPMKEDRLCFFLVMAAFSLGRTTSWTFFPGVCLETNIC